MILNRPSYQGTWDYLIGSSKSASLESKIFHTISIIAILSSLVIAWYNFSTTLFYAGCLSIAFGLTQSVLYFLSRFRGMHKTATYLSAIQVNIIFILGWLYNSGIAGSISLLLLVSLALIILITPKKAWPYFFAANLLITLTLMVAEYLYPDVIQQHYITREELFTDQAFTYLAASFLLFMCTSQLRKSYVIQKELAEEKAAKLATMNEAKDKLFSIISHDLNAPLNAIKQYLDLLLIYEPTEQERRSVERNLGRAVSDTGELLQNLLFWARSQMNNIPVDRQPINLQKHLLPGIDLFRNIASLKEISLHDNIEPTLQVLGDKDMMDVVIRNLLNNAIKFSNANSIIEISAYAENERIIIAVSDTGIGIDVQDQKEIFSGSFKPSFGTESEKGTGLGLSLCRDFMVRQGGEIWLTSQPGQGTTFYVSYPPADQ